MGKKIFLCVLFVLFQGIIELAASTARETALRDTTASLCVTGRDGGDL